MKKNLRCLYFIILFLNYNSFAQQKSDYSTQIDSLLQMVKPRPFNGVVFISQNGKMKYSKVAGYANFDQKTPLKLNSEFEVMSNSKQITAVLLLREVDKGKIILQAPIKKYLPYLTQTWADSVTVHQLLNHTHGITNIEKPLIFKAGTDFKYGNLSNILLGEIIEFSSKESYIKMATRLFKELKMKNTYCYSKEKNQKLVTGHLNKNNIFQVLSKDSTLINTKTIPAAGIVSTVKDLAIWNMNLHKGKILKPETYKLMTSHTVLAQHNVFGKDKIGYGYGIRISENEAPKFMGHTGLGDGFAAVNLYFPDTSVCLIVLENQMNDNFEINYHFGTEIRKILTKSNLTNKK